DSALALGLQPSPKQPPRPPWAQTATRPTPLAAPGHHRPSLPPATTTPRHLFGHHRLDRHISASLSYHTAHNHHISAGTSNTQHPQSVPKPPIMHHRRPNLRTPCPTPALLLTAPPLRVSTFPVRDLHAT
ncbi:hypothetical protein C0993_011587, partial [Termitomyces sp. T159_Od127]